eukprot:180292_1
MGLCCSSSAKDADLELGESLVSLEEGNGTDEMVMPSNSSGWFSIRREHCFLTAVVVVILIFAIAGKKLLSSDATNNLDQTQQNLVGPAIGPIKYVFESYTRKTIELQDGQHWKDAVLEIMKENSDVDSDEIDRDRGLISYKMQYCEEAGVNVFYKKDLGKDAEKMGVLVHRILLFMLYRSGDDCVVSPHIGSFEIPSDA